MIRRLLVVFAVLTFVVLTFAAAAPVAAVAQDRESRALVVLRANGGSGIIGMIRVDGRQVRGVATGLDPARRYITLYYADQSTPLPDQPNTCADVRTAVGAALPRPARDWTTSPEWRVHRGGVGRLDARADRLVTTAPRTVTVSIRLVPPTAGRDPYVGFTPVTYPVVACGAVRTTR